MKSKTVALILSIFVGYLGIDRFYLGYTRIGIMKLLTCGCCGILYLIDILQIATGKLQPADGSAYDETFRITPPSANASSPSTELEKLAKLHQEGSLTDEEFAKAKQAYFNKH